MIAINETHSPRLRSWVTSANEAGCDFPIQNLPFGRFRALGSNESLRIGVAIGDQVLDLKAAGLIDTDDMNLLMAAHPEQHAALRSALSQGLAKGSAKQESWAKALLPQSMVEMGLPCQINGYTDFYTGIHHAKTVGSLFRPDNPLMPNYKWVPIGYHGRVSSIMVSGRCFKRPLGQIKKADAETPIVNSSQRLDYELELGYIIGRGNARGEPISIAQAEQHLFGVTLLNDWSARDIQAWEYQPLGPFLSKNFATSLSPWIVTMSALAPFRAKFERPAGDPQPLSYLDDPLNREQGALDITLEVWLLTSKMRREGCDPTRLTRTKSGQAAYWTPGQLVAHHTVNGCNLEPGDLLGSGTLSGRGLDEAGSLLELTFGGKSPIVLANGEHRTFLEDGDTLILRGWCEREGAARIGLGEVSGTVLSTAD